MERVEKSNKRKRRRGDVYMEARSEKIEGVQLCIFLKKKKIPDFIFSKNFAPPL